MKRNIKRRAGDVLYRFLTVLPPGRGGVILTYHSISYAKHFGAVTPENFRIQMDALKKHGFSVVTLDELAHMREHGKILPRTVALTFDDGYEDNYDVAFPILKSHGFPATIFVATDGLGKTRIVRGETFSILSEPQIRELSASGLVSIEPHTVSHPKLTKVTEAEVEQEIMDSKGHLESITSTTCRHFAYPHGQHNAGSEKAAQRVGISYAYTTQDGFVQMNQAENMRLKRNGINRTIVLPEFIGIALWGKINRARFVKVVRN